MSLLIDSRINHQDDFHAAVACTLLGEAGEVPAGARDWYLAIYLAKHPTLRDFVSQPDCALVAVRVTECALVVDLDPTTRTVRADACCHGHGEGGRAAGDGQPHITQLYGSQ